jgi:hypothetical protein
LATEIGAGDDDVLAAEKVVHVSSALDVLGIEIVGVIVSGEAFYAEIVQELSHLLGLCFGPFVVGGVELDALVAHLGDCLYGGLWILLEFFADGIQLEADGKRFQRLLCEGPG